VTTSITFKAASGIFVPGPKIAAQPILLIELKNKRLFDNQFTHQLLSATDNLEEELLLHK
jgi:hypothetical protein